MVWWVVIITFCGGMYLAFFPFFSFLFSFLFFSFFFSLFPFVFPLLFLPPFLLVAGGGYADGDSPRIPAVAMLSRGRGSQDGYTASYNGIRGGGGGLLAGRDTSQAL